VLAHSHGLVDLRIAAADERQIPYLTESLGEPLAINLAELVMVADDSTPAPGHESRYRLTLPHADLPRARLVLSTPARVFDRTIRVRSERPPRDGRSEPRFEEVAAAHWRHSDTEEPSTDLVIKLPSLDSAQAEIVVDEGDNSPLPLQHPRLLLPAYRLRFFRPDDRKLSLFYGAPEVGAPRYDLALLAPRVLSAAAHEVQAGPEAMIKPQPRHPPALAQKRFFWVALVLAIMVLIGLIARLVRND
jgi:hypothetical protein